MNTENIVMCVVALLLGMLLANMLKNVCGCKNIVEGQELTGEALLEAQVAAAVEAAETEEVEEAEAAAAAGAAARASVAGDHRFALYDTYNVVPGTYITDLPAAQQADVLDQLCPGLPAHNTVRRDGFLRNLMNLEDYCTDQLIAHPNRESPLEECDADKGSRVQIVKICEQARAGLGS